MNGICFAMGIAAGAALFALFGPLGVVVGYVLTMTLVWANRLRAR